MKAPLKVIEELGCPTDSYIAAIQFLIQKNFNKVEFEKQVQDIIGLSEPPECYSWFTARALFLYVVQETIRQYQTGIIPLMEEVYKTAVKKMEMYTESNPWNETRFNIEHGLKVDFDVEAGDEGPALSTKKGAKKHITEKLFRDLKAAGASRQKIIEAFVEQVGMSKACATTYFHALKKQLGFSERTNPTEQISKHMSKQELAEQLYEQSIDKSKPTIIDLFVEKLGTSKLGAQTYYYAVKKKKEQK